MFSSGLEECLNKAAGNDRLAQKEKEQDLYHGIGVACTIHGTWTQRIF